MEWSLYDDITRQIALQSRATTVLYDLHNEPLLNPDIFAWIRHMKVSAPRSRCVLTTNGALLDRFAPSDIEGSHVDLLAVSLNAHRRETYEKLNCGLDFDHVVENILRLADVPALKPRLRVDFVMTEVNCGEFREARQSWRRRGIKTFQKPLSNRAGALDNYDSLTPTRKRPLSVPRALRSLARRRIGCPLPFYQMNVLQNGDAILCCHDWTHECVVGTASRQSLREVWNSPTMQSIRRSLVSGRSRSIIPCRDCSLASG